MEYISDLVQLAPTKELSVTKKFWINVAVLFIFGIIYTVYLSMHEDHWATPLGDDEKFSDADKLLNGFYASIIIHTSVGFGDFYPKHAIPKILVAVHSVIVFFVNLVM